MRCLHELEHKGFGKLCNGLGLEAHAASDGEERFGEAASIEKPEEITGLDAEACAANSADGKIKLLKLLLELFAQAVGRTELYFVNPVKGNKIMLLMLHAGYPGKAERFAFGLIMLFLRFIGRRSGGIFIKSLPCILAADGSEGKQQGRTYKPRILIIQTINKKLGIRSITGELCKKLCGISAELGRIGAQIPPHGREYPRVHT